MNKYKRLIVVTLAACGLLLADFTSAFAQDTNWNVSLWGKRRAFTEHVEKLAELVKAKTNGEFNMTISYGGLSKPKENLDGIAIGAFEMAQFCAGYHPDKNPTLTVLELPFLGISNLEQEIKVSKAVYNHPATQKDLGRWQAKLLMPTPMPQYNVAGKGKEVSDLTSFAGMRIRATGGIGKAFTIIGAIPTSMPATEVYNAMESGVIDAASFAPHAHIAFRTIDIAKWWTQNLDPGTLNCPVVVNIDAYKALPPAHRKALVDSVDKALDHYVSNYNALLERWQKIIDDKNIKKIKFSPAVIADFKTRVAKPARDEWIQEMTARGIPAKELYNLTQSALNN